ncbi:MAG TPA: hypothetical protein VJT73_15895 [Polyangiaceae bacterium]|nr:hypothetical protein [Polyangiaceae bacterium]
MIAFNRRASWQSLLASSLVALAACSSSEPGAGFEQALEDDEPGAIAGEFVSYIADYEDGTTETQHFLRREDGTERRLYFQVEPEIAPGSRLRVWGSEKADSINVSKYKMPKFQPEPVGVASQRAALIGAEASVPKKFCTVIVGLNGATVPTTCANNGTNCVTETNADQVFYSGPRSVNAYYQENSYGQDSLSGKVVGTVNYQMASGCSFGPMANAVRGMFPDEKCDQWGLVMTPNAKGCGWAGLGEVGTSDKPARVTWYNNTLGCVAAVQEPGHNYGGLHSASMDCGTGRAFLDDPASCKHSEYGDRFDTMGGGCRHMNAWQKLYQKWWGGCNAIKVTQSGTFNLYPTEKPCDGVQAIQVPFPGGKVRRYRNRDLTSYFLEYRTPVGFDGTTGNTKPMTAQVLVHVAPNPILPNQVNPRGSETWIINVGNSTDVQGLTLGGVKSFSDPAGGVTIAVTAMDGEKAVIDVKVDNPADNAGPTVCLDGKNTVLVGSGPATCNGPVVTLPDGGGAGGSKLDAGPDTGRRDAMAETGSSVGAGGGTGGSGIVADGAAGTANGVGGSTAGGNAAGTRNPTGGPGGGDEGGCTCKIAAPSTSGRATAPIALGLGLAGLFASRRRSRRHDA